MRKAPESVSDIELVDAGLGDDLSVPKSRKPAKRKKVIPPVSTVPDSDGWKSGYIPNSDVPDGLYWFYGDRILKGVWSRPKRAILIEVRAVHHQRLYWDVLNRRYIDYLEYGYWKPVKPGALPEWRF